MPKFRPYESPAQFLAKEFRIEEIYSSYNKYILRQPCDFSKSPDLDSPLFEFIDWNFILGGLNPLISSGKDVADTFKPYKSFYYVIRDVIQPLRGLGNIIKGLFDIAATPIILVYNSIKYANLARRKRNLEYFTKPITEHVMKALGHLLGGITSIIRGIGQVFTTPLTWLRIPVRRVRTYVTGWLTLSDEVQERASNLTKLAQKEDKKITEAVAFDQGIHSLITKSRKAAMRNQNFGEAQEVPIEYVITLAPFDTILHYMRVLGFFNPRIKVDKHGKLIAEPAGDTKGLVERKVKVIAAREVRL